MVSAFKIKEIALLLLVCIACDSTVLGSHGSVFTVDPSGYSASDPAKPAGVLNWYNQTSYTSETIASSNAFGVVAGDIDGDGNLDVLVGRTINGYGTVWYEDRGNGFVVVTDAFGTNIVKNGLAVGDIDNDGHPDIFLVRNDGDVMWYESRSDNSLTWLSNAITSSGVAADLGNFDGDNYSDLFVVKTNAISWYEGNGTVDSIGWVRNMNIAGAVAVEIGDVDGDSSNDLLIVDANHTVKWYESAGNGANPIYRTSFDANATSVAVVDIDADGKNEVLVAHNGYAVGWYKSTSDNSISSISGVVFGVDAIDISACKNFNNTDIFVTDNSHTLIQHHLDGNNCIKYLKELLTLDSVCGVGIDNFDGDDYPDLIVARTGTSCIWFEIDGDNLLSVQNGFSYNTKANGICVTDLNNDGHGDVFTMSTTGEVTWYHSQNDNSLSWKSNLTGSGVAIAAGNVDGDSKKDLFVVKSASTSWYEASNIDPNNLVWLKDIASGGFVGPKDIAIGNVDGDNYGDIALVKDNGDVDWYESNGTDNATPNYVVTVYNGKDANSVSIFDVDGDGTNEVLVTVNDSNVRWFESYNNNTLSPITGTAFGHNCTDIAAYLTPEVNSPLINFTTSTVYDINNGDDLMFPTLQIDPDNTKQLWTGFEAGSHPEREYSVMMHSNDGGDTWTIPSAFCGFRTGTFLPGDNPHAVSVNFNSNVSANPKVVKTKANYIYDTAPLTKPDMFAVRDNRIYLYEPVNGDNANPAPICSFAEDANNPPTDVTVVDMNGDGNNVLLVARSGTGVSWYTSDADDSIKLCTGTDFGYDLVDIDAYRDSSGNVWVSTADTSHQINWYKADSNSPNVLHWITAVDANGVAVCIGDFDADSLVDLFVGNNMSNDPYTKWFEFNPGNNQFTKIKSDIDGQLVTERGLDMGDIDGDGNTDLMLLRTSKELMWYECSGNNNLATHTCYWYNRDGGPQNSDYALDKNTVALAIGDFDGDSNLDMLTSTDAGKIDFWEQYGANDTVYWNGQTWDANITSIAIGRMDRDVLVKRDCSITFPNNVNSMNFHQSMIRQDDGTLLATMYGKFTSDSTFRVVIVESSDMGLTWNYKSTVATRSASWMGSEGPCEPVMVKLSNGNFLCVVRTGMIPNATLYSNGNYEGECPMIACISTDDCNTWSSPVNLRTPGVAPNLIVLDNNDVLLSYGRPETHLRFADPNGQNWSSPIDISVLSGCGYTGLRQDSDGIIHLIYGESDFSAWWRLDGAENYMKHAAIILEN